MIALRIFFGKNEVVPAVAKNYCGFAILDLWGKYRGSGSRSCVDCGPDSPSRRSNPDYVKTSRGHGASGPNSSQEVAFRCDRGARCHPGIFLVAPEKCHGYPKIFLVGESWGPYT